MLLQTSPMFNSYLLRPSGQTLKLQTWYIWSLWCFDKIAHTPKPVFHLHVYCFIQSWWLCSICFHNIRPQHISIRWGCIHSSPAAWRGRGRGRRQPLLCAPERPGLWVTPPCVRLCAASFPPRLIVAPMELNCLLLQSWRDSQLLSLCQKTRKEDKERRRENQFLIKRICKGCIKRCSTFTLALPPGPCDLENAGLLLTNHTCARWGRKCCFVLIDGSWLAKLANHNANQCQDVCLCERWQDDWIYFIQLYVNVLYILIKDWSFKLSGHSYRPPNSPWRTVCRHYS